MVTMAEPLDGLQVRLAAASEKAYKAGLSILAQARDAEQAEALVGPLSDLLDEIERWKSAWAAKEIDKIRQVEAAVQRSEDCEHHGAEIRHERHQAYWFSILAEANDEERMGWVDACFQLVNMFSHHDPDQAGEYEKRLRKASQKSDRTRARHTAPTLADCQRAGRCEHPDTKPHGACEQLALFEVPHA